MLYRSVAKLRNRSFPQPQTAAYVPGTGIMTVPFDRRLGEFRINLADIVAFPDAASRAGAVSPDAIAFNSNQELALTFSGLPAVLEAVTFQDQSGFTTPVQNYGNVV